MYKLAAEPENWSGPLNTSSENREMPQNIEAEQALLGALFIDNKVYERISEFLLPSHFIMPVHGRIYEAILKLIERGQLANPVTLKGYFAHDEMIKNAGGTDYLSDLAESAISTINAPDYARMIYDLSLRRELIRVGEELVQDLFKPNLEQAAEEYIRTTEQKLYDLATGRNLETGFQNFSVALTSAIKSAEAAYKRDGKLVGIATGLVDLDRFMGGMHPSDLIILAGRPSMGKTALATNIAFNAAKAYKFEKDKLGRTHTTDGGVIGFFSLEMSSEQLAMRLLAEQTGIPSEKIRKGELTHEDFLKVVRGSQEVSQIPLFIDDTPALSLPALRSRARRLKRQHNLSVIMVDYLQLLHVPGMKGDNRVNEISEITRGLKAIAKELNVPVIALSQLSRAVEQREDKRPQLSDLRESGSIEQDADIVMFVFREQYYLERMQPVRKGEESEEKFNERMRQWAENMARVVDIAEVIIAKHRHGGIGKVPLRFNSSTTKFENLDHARVRETY
jgi:replicative DNA helicase